jgi:protein-S-isoprenylcysteine O-methyltransferase Ste14
MKVSAVVFRIRFYIHALIYFLGFAVPWERWLRLDMDRNGSAWLLLSAWPARNHWLSFTEATVGFLVLGGLCAVVAAWLRTWASAYLGVSTVHSHAMHGDAMVAEGPYRYVRNPLYLGIIVHTFALALLMPPSGAIFAVVLVTAFQFVLISGEESFLGAKLGAAYEAYRARVPRGSDTLRRNQTCVYL